MPEIVEVLGTVALEGDLPANEFEGRTFFVEGATPPGLFRDNGVDSWDRVSISEEAGGSGVLPYHIPLDATYVNEGTPGTTGDWFEFGSPSVAETVENGRRVTRIPTGTAGIKGTAGDKPSGTNWTITWGIVPHLFANDGAGSGIAVMESSLGQTFVEVYFDATDGWMIRSGKQDGYNAAATISDEVILGFCPPLIFLRMDTTDEVTFTCSFSFDGRNYTVLPTPVDRTSVMDSVNNQAAYVRVPAASDPVGLAFGTTIVHIEVT